MVKSTLHLGDCTKIMPTLPADSVDLAITSPPYFVGKEYEKSWTLDYFKSLMTGVFDGVKHVLKPGGYLVVNFGDCYNSGNRFYGADVPSVYPASLLYWEWGRHADFDLQATRIWRKRFAKLSIPFVCNTHPRNIFDYEHIWTFRKKNGSNKEIVNDRKLSQRGVVGDEWGSSAKIGVNGASFPVELPLWAIDVYSKEGDVVLDPFSGTGTTALACLLKKRNHVGIELDKATHDYAENRLEEFRQTNIYI